MNPYQPNRRRRLAAVVGGFFVLTVLLLGALVNTPNQTGVNADSLPTFADDPDNSDGPYTFNPVDANDKSLDSYLEATLDTNKNCQPDTLETVGYTASTVTDSTLRLFSSLPAGQYIVTAYGNDEPLVGTLCVVAGGSSNANGQAVTLVPGGDPVKITLVELSN